MSKLKLITERVEDLQVNESADTGELYIEGIFSSAELQNQNGRRYKKETLKREVDRMMESIRRRSQFGELNHPTSPEINLERAAILIESLEWRGNNVYGKAKILNTPLGMIARELIKEGTIGISSRGLGTVNEDGYVNDKNYRMITYDLVGNPSNTPSWVKGIYEGESFEVVGTTTPEDIMEAQIKYSEYLKNLLAEITKKI